jgi:hypothetical protein
MLKERTERAKVRKALYCIFLLSPLSYLFSTLYTGGDQLHYHQVYELISDKGLIESYLIYYNKLNSSELGHFILTWLASGLIEKNLFFTVLNTLLLMYGVLFLSRVTHRSPLLILILLLSNYYIFVLMFSAERLKVAFLFLFAFMYYYQKISSRMPLLLMAIISHLSIVLLIVSSFVPRLIRDCRRLISAGKLNIALLKYFILFTFVAVVLLDQIYNKIFGYLLEYFDVFNILKITALTLFVAFFIRNQRSTYFSVMFVLGIAAIIIGDDRVNIFAFLYTQYHFLLHEKLKSLPFVMMAIYLFLKALEFIYKVVNYADAYYVAT